MKNDEKNEKNDGDHDVKSTTTVSSSSRMRRMISKSVINANTFTHFNFNEYCLECLQEEDVNTFKGVEFKKCLIRRGPLGDYRCRNFACDFDKRKNKTSVVRNHNFYIFEVIINRKCKLYYGHLSTILSMMRTALMDIYNPHKETCKCYAYHDHEGYICHFEDCDCAECLEDCRNSSDDDDDSSDSDNDNNVESLFNNNIIINKHRAVLYPTSRRFDNIIEQGKYYMIRFGININSSYAYINSFKKFMAPFEVDVEIEKYLIDYYNSTIEWYKDYMKGNVKAILRKEKDVFIEDDFRQMSHFYRYAYKLRNRLECIPFKDLLPYFNRLGELKINEAYSQLLSYYATKEKRYPPITSRCDTNRDAFDSAVTLYLRDYVKLHLGKDVTNMWIDKYNIFTNTPIENINQRCFKMLESKLYNHNKLSSPFGLGFNK